MAYLVAKDGSKLAYRLFRSNHPPECILVIPSHLYLQLHKFARTLATLYPIMIVLVDLRGYGQSGGRRAATADRKDLWRDLRTTIRHFKYNYPLLPIYLGTRVADLPLFAHPSSSSSS